jgi:Bacterial dnaA protein helix-turn-helix
MSHTDHTRALTPSPALRRATETEQRRLKRAGEKLQTKRAALQARIDALDAELEQLDERYRLLAAIAAPHETVATPTEARGGPVGADGLKGAAIRRAAVRVLLASGRHTGIHYRAWYRLLVDAGYAVSGSDPLATFLTNIGRSPVVAHARARGVFRVDFSAPDRIAAELAAKRCDLVALTSEAAANPAGLDALGASQYRLVHEIGRLERARAEAIAALQDPAPETVADDEVALIQRLTAELFGISVEQLLSRSRADAECWPRQLAMALARDLTDRSLLAIGQGFGRDHTTVLNACQRVAERVARDLRAREQHATLKATYQLQAVSGEAEELAA